MIRKYIDELAKNSPCQFELLSQECESLDFYIAGNKDYERFLVVLESATLPTPGELNELVRLSTPDQLLQDPSYAKNTDLVVLFNVNDLTDLYQHEHSIFDIEEDGYSFKKHVLYFTDEEVSTLGQKEFNQIEELLLDQESFKQYKDSPTTQSAYSLACRLFVKLPFLQVPVKETELQDASRMADDLLKKAGLLELTSQLEQLITSGNDHQTVIEEYAREQMANQTTRN